MAKGPKLFDEYDDEDKGYNDQEDSEDGPSDLVSIRQILLSSKIEVLDEDCNEDYDTILTLDSDVRMCFDQDGKLIRIEPS